MKTIVNKIALFILIMFSIVLTFNSAKAQSIAACGVHSLFLCTTSGVVKSNGYNGEGGLGDGTTINRSTPVQVNGLTGITAIGGGDVHSLFLKSDGTVWACGSNVYGQLGDGTNTTRTSPVQVSGLTGITALSGGNYHSLFLKSNGTVWACGFNAEGELGNGSFTNSNIPVQVSGLTGITAISSSGGFHSLFLKSDGTVWACGLNAQGQLGNGTFTTSNTPVQVNGLTNIIAIAGGGYHSLFLKSDGTVQSCGYNNRGQLGDGTTTSRTTTVEVTGLTGIVAIASGTHHSLFLKGDGTVQVCGYNSSGQLGDGSIVNRMTIVQVSGLTGVTAIAGGVFQSLFLKSDGSEWACGGNFFGQLGDGTTTGRTTVVQTLNISNPVCQNGGIANAICGCDCPPGFAGALCQNSCVVPATPVVTNNSTQCGYGIPTASVTGNGGSFRWYLSSTGGTPIAGETQNHLVATPINVTTNFYVSEVIGICESGRVLVSATVTIPPLLTLTPSQNVCLNSITTLNATSSIGDYETFTWSPITNLYQNPAGNIPYTGQNLTTVYIKTIASGTTVYTCTAENSTATCVNIATVTITESTDDGDVCTIDACDPSTGIVTHTQVNIDDNISCTVDGCNSVTGVFHIRDNDCYCISKATMTSDEDIFNFTINGASTNSLYSYSNNCTTIAPGPGSQLSLYSNFKNLGSLTNFIRGSSVSFVIDENECDGAPYQAFDASIWIDFNHDGIFQNNEQVFIESTPQMGPRSISGNISIPITALLGCTAIRIVVADGLSGPDITPCLEYGNGETEDYMVCIKDLCQGSPMASTITPHYASPCDSNSVITFTASGNDNITGLNYQWQVSNNPSGPWTNVGSNSTTYTTTSPLSTLYYNCLTTCSVSSLTTPSLNYGLNPFPPIVINLDTVVCNGIEGAVPNVHHKYSFSFKINNSTNSTANIISITSSDATVTVFSNATLNAGINTITGEFHTSGALVSAYNIICINLNIAYPSSADTCINQVCFLLPDCSGNVCDSNLLRNGTFKLGNIAGTLTTLGGNGAIDNWSAGYGSPVVYNDLGCDEVGYVRLLGNKINGDAIKQSMDPAHKIISGKTYVLSFCCKFDSVLSQLPYVKFRAIAFNGNLPNNNNHPSANTDIAILGYTGKINAKDWSTTDMQIFLANKDFDNIAINVFNNDSTQHSIGYIDGVCLHEAPGCDCDSIEIDSLGNYILPPELAKYLDQDNPSPEIDSVDFYKGSDHDLYYPCCNTDLDTNYVNCPCNCCPTIGGTVPDEASNVNIDDSLIAKGIHISAASIEHLFAHIGDSLSTVGLDTADLFNLGALDSLCHCDSTTASPSESKLLNSPFCGKDIVFVQGWDPTTIFLKSIYELNPFSLTYPQGTALTSWPHDKKEFYNSGGFWHDRAADYWYLHIFHYLGFDLHNPTVPSSFGFTNRILVVSYATTQRLAYAVHSVLWQINQAMANGLDVINLDPADPRGTSDFGKNGYVIISHSTGALLTDVAMDLANQTKTIPYVQKKLGYIGEISERASLHISLHGALSGSNEATGFIAAATTLKELGPEIGAAIPLPGVDAVVGFALKEIGNNMYKSVGHDLVPAVSQLWMYTLGQNTPVPVITVAGGHPNEYTFILKNIFNKGFDDGALTMDCQCGNNRLYLSWPTSYIPDYSILDRLVYDMGVPSKRANKYFYDQVIQAFPVPKFYVSSACVNDLSVTGMQQPVSSGSGYSHYPNHNTFLQSASDHNYGPLGPYNAPNNYYDQGPIDKQNNYEEQRAISNNALYAPAGPICSDMKNLMGTTIRGKNITFHFRIFKWHFSRTWWIWKRTYHNLAGYETMSEEDYVYQYVLKHCCQH